MHPCAPVVLALVAGCYRPEFATCATRCGTDGGCPEGFHCLADRVCHTSAEEPLCDVTMTGDAAQACAGDTCTQPPSVCHADRGTCIDERCVYAYKDGGPCTAPLPPPACMGSTLRTYATPSTCAAGACTFAYTDKACLAGCSGTQCTTPQACIDMCDHLSSCGLSISQCRTKCRDRCDAAELNQLEVCAGTICEQTSACLALVDCLP